MRRPGHEPGDRHLRARPAGRTPLRHRRHQRPARCPHDRHPRERQPNSSSSQHDSHRRRGCGCLDPGLGHLGRRRAPRYGQPATGRTPDDRDDARGTDRRKRGDPSHRPGCHRRPGLHHHHGCRSHGCHRHDRQWEAPHVAALAERPDRALRDRPSGDDPSPAVAGGGPAGRACPDPPGRRQRGLRHEVRVGRGRRQAARAVTFSTAATTFDDGRTAPMTTLDSQTDLVAFLDSSARTVGIRDGLLGGPEGVPVVAAGALKYTRTAAPPATIRPDGAALASTQGVADGGTTALDTKEVDVVTAYGVVPKHATGVSLWAGGSRIQSTLLTGELPGTDYLAFYTSFIRDKGKGAPATSVSWTDPTTGAQHTHRVG